MQQRKSALSPGEFAIDPKQKHDLAIIAAESTGKVEKYQSKYPVECGTSRAFEKTEVCLGVCVGVHLCVCVCVCVCHTCVCVV